MKLLASYLDELKEIKKLNTDTEIAEFMRVSRQHISRIRAGDYMSEEKCFLLAQYLDRDPLELISVNRALRAKNQEIREFWTDVHNKCVRQPNPVGHGGPLKTDK